MPRDARLVLIASCLGMLAVGENSTAIMAALPAMSSSLGLGPATVEWAVNAYLLAAAAFIILGGEAADEFGPRRSSAAGTALFAFASLIIALAPDGVVVVAARALQGLGAAFAVAGTLAAVTEAALEAERAGAISAWTGFLMLVSVLGRWWAGSSPITPAGGQFLAERSDHAPAGLALGLGLRPRSGGRQTNQVDWLGLGLLAFFMAMLISGYTRCRPPVPPHAPPSFRSRWQHVLRRAALGGDAQPPAATRLRFFSNQNFALSSVLAFLLMFDIMTLLLYYNLFAQAPDGLG